VFALVFGILIVSETGYYLWMSGIQIKRGTPQKSVPPLVELLGYPNI
jgi:hypothetical protein